MPAAGRALLAAAGVLALLLPAAPPAGAWRATLHAQMAVDAAGFLPAALQGLMRLYGSDVVRGLAEAGTYSRQLFDPAAGRSEARIAEELEHEMREITAMIRDHRPFAGVFFRMGRLVGPVAELHVPLRWAPAELPLLSDALDGYERLSEAAAPKYRILWDGYRDELMTTLPPSVYFADAAREARSLHAVLHAALVVDGQLVPITSFDYRSIPFGVASMTYSRSVNSVVHVWCAIWREAGGDMSGRPY